MRLNTRELACLAQQAANVDKEGVLYVKEKQDGIFKKSEVYIDRFFRLKGNLLFYFKNKETRAEPLGLFVLERCTVELDLEEEAPNSFMIVCEGEDNPFKFAAVSEDERDSWIQALHMASYECLKMQLQSLREQVQAKTGHDPVAMPDAAPSGLDFDIQTDSTSEDPVLEISLSCSNLSCDSQGTPPNCLVVVHIIVPGQQQLWVHHNHTEIFDKSCNPMFLKTIGFGDANGVDTSTRVRLTVYNVKERMTGTMAQLGQAIFTLQDVLMNPDLTLTLALQSHDIKSKGNITVMAWVNDNKVTVAELHKACIAASPVKTDGRDQQRAACKQIARTLASGNLRTSLEQHFSNIIKRSFRFATNVQDANLQVHEYMGEFQHCFSIPCQLLRIWIDEEKQKNSLLQDLGELGEEITATVRQAQKTVSATITLYYHQLQELMPLIESTFKRSVDKDRTALEFVPVNLHLQCMAVGTDFKSAPGAIYDIVTMGAPTAFNKKYKNGGLRRMLQQQYSTHTADSTLGGRTKLQRACSLRNQATDLRSEVLKLSEGLCTLANSRSLMDMKKACSQLVTKARELVTLCADPVLCAAADMYVQAKRQSEKDGQDTASSLRTVSSTMPDNSHRWSGTNFVRSPTTEPWEVTRLNLEAAVVCLLSLVEGLSCRDSGATQDWQQEVIGSISKLQSFVDLVSAKISLFLTFLTIMENKDNIQKMHEIKYRRDIVNSHAITALLAAVCAMVEGDRFVMGEFSQQLLHCGLLVQWEGLLSCYGDEMGMIEDMAVAVDDLNFVRLKFVSMDSSGGSEPTMSMGSHVKEGIHCDFNRHEVIASVPVAQELFEQLPPGIQNGHLIRVRPCFFNIGINEDATCAEKGFGSTALQERINLENSSKLNSYFEKLAEVHKDSVEMTEGLNIVGSLLKLLHTNVNAKKNKNVEVLHLASEICQRLGGLRITACKSGKDRTSMGVTLETVQTLQRYHGLASHVFSQALDCLRSVGCRRENTYKNTGVRKYAFNRFQMLYIPKLYRAPGGTYGNIIT